MLDRLLNKGMLSLPMQMCIGTSVYHEYGSNVYSVVEQTLNIVSKRGVLQKYETKRALRGYFKDAPYILPL
jgi:hypothetical protein